MGAFWYLIASHALASLRNVTFQTVWLKRLSAPFAGTPAQLLLSLEGPSLFWIRERSAFSVKRDGTSDLNPDLKNTGVPHPNFEWLEEKQTRQGPRQARLTQIGTACPDRNSLSYPDQTRLTQIGTTYPDRSSFPR